MKCFYHVFHGYQETAVFKHEAVHQIDFLYLKEKRRRANNQIISGLHKVREFSQPSECLHEAM